jgi:copper resistance protein D
LDDPLYVARFLHFAATLLVAGDVFFVVFVAAPAWRDAKDAGAAVRARLAWIAWFGWGLALASGAVWLVATAAGMSGEPLTEVFSGDVLGTVLTQTRFGNTWLIRFVVACCLAGLFAPLFSARPEKSSWLSPAAAILAAVLAGSLAWSGHAAGGLGIEAVLHPTADVLHLIAAAAWIGALLPLAVLLAMTGPDALSVARTATLRFSTLGIISVATLLFSGIVNTWYLVGSVDALTGTQYGRLLTIKIALFVVMVGFATVNRLRLTPQLIQDASPTAIQSAYRWLRRNTAIETAIGVAIIGIVAVLGTLPPASHAGHHSTSGPVPADAAFQHIHSEDGMADVMIQPGRVGTARVTIHFWNDDFAPLAVKGVTVALTAPSAGSKPVTFDAKQDAEGAWTADNLDLSESGNWTVRLDATLGTGRPLVLEAPIVIDAK